jgi:hypothetical protein
MKLRDRHRGGVGYQRRSRAIPVRGRAKGTGLNATFPGHDRQKVDWRQRNVEFVRFDRWLGAESVATPAQ